MLTNIDEYNSEDVVNASFQYIKERDWKFLPSGNYINDNFSIKNRSNLINWFYEVCWKYKSLPECFQEAVNLFDRYNSNNFNNFENIGIKYNYQCIIICYYVIVSKNKEVEPISMENLLDVSYNNYQSNEMIKTEKNILITLGYNINYSSILQFVRWLSPIFIHGAIIYTISRYFANLCYLSSLSLKYTASKMACACVFLACFFHFKDNNDIQTVISCIYERMEFHIDDYLEISHKLIDFIILLRNTLTYRSIYTGYTTFKNLKCSIFVDENIDKTQELLSVLYPEPKIIVEKIAPTEKSFSRIIKDKLPY